MARAPFATVSMILLSFAVQICLSILHQNLMINTNNSPLILNTNNTPTTTTMFLPLYFNDNNKFVNSAPKHSRRHLKTRRRPNARMPLHDDLLINGYYTTRLWIGTPPQRFALIVDTGSTVTYVPCATCELCGKHQDPRFQPELSSTYQPVKCNIDCSCDNDREQCTYERQYAEMSSSSGVLGEDIVSFGNQSELPPQRAVFGCENMETGDLYSQHADGIMGLGHGDLSIVDQLVDKGVISDSFSLCYGGMDVGGGAMVLGGIIPPSDMVFARSDPDRSPYYNIDLKEIHVAGKALPLSPKVFDGKHGTVLDSGTTYAYLPESAFAAFKDAIMKSVHSLKQIKGPDPNYNDICFSGSSSDSSQLSKTFPSVDMVFNNGQKLSMSPENYLFRHSKVRGAYCLGVFQNGKDPTTLLGGIVVRNTLVTYDREHEKIGFWKTDCSKIWERLHISTSPAPLPTISNTTNTTTDMAPRLAPREPPRYDIPGVIKIGLITFYMSLSVKYSDLKPHISELAKFISEELAVNVSQVRLMNSTSKGNDSLIRWGIFPPQSDDYIANASAMVNFACFNSRKLCSLVHIQ
ncbi:aspartic ase 2 isoform X1 [Olea europaea subsp. europaea]|uniref:Aspartic ase 2 isoform X1 n=1 Tax=Olea europaea subsp. europaea TaxID=158383 RepID=A0A8S0URY7_OLEEU|nr:aspartic ase 2 isoform X1 [Olea europaea subsp. europaea]